MKTDLKTALAKLLSYCQAADWAGYDPYDALNSRLFATAPFLNTKLVRLTLTQALKRSPINFRRVLFVPKKQNPKALGLFLSAFSQLTEIGLPGYEGLAGEMIERLAALRAQGVDYSCWGYSFPWQTRTLLVPAGSPNLVCTVFVANALLDAYKGLRDPACLEMAKSAGEYLLNDLYWSDESSLAGFSYPRPGVRDQIHNANFLAAALLCRLARYSREERFLARALKAARYAASQQQKDGSWYYGEGPSERWIDNFPTGYNLCALRTIARHAEVREFNSCIERGIRFYLAHFFRADGAPRYFHDRTYPIDIHSVAQSIVTLLEFRDFDSSNVTRARSVFQWAMDHMWDERGFFYYRVLRSGAIRIPYMRWSQAWMFLAMSKLLVEEGVKVNEPLAQSASAPALS